MEYKDYTDNTKTCPGCGRHCDLSEPHCERGRIFAETGTLPEREHREETDERRHWHEGTEDGPRRERHGNGFEGHHGSPEEMEDSPCRERHGEGFEGHHGRPEETEDGPHHGRRGEDFEGHRGRPGGPDRRCERMGERGPRGGAEGGMREWPDPEDIPDDTDGRLAFCLRAAGRMMRMRSDGREGQKRILVMLNGGPLTQRDLTERLGIQPGSASEIVSKLESGGMIRRTPNPEDRRTMDIQLTEAGREEAVRAEENRRASRAEMFSCLSGEEKAALTGLLEKLMKDWKERMPR